MRLVPAPRKFARSSQVWSRRQFALRIPAALAASRLLARQEEPRGSALALAKDGRSPAFRRVLDLLGHPDFQGKEVYLKGSYNSADEFPASTHPEMLSEVVRYLYGRGARRVLLVERSGMELTERVWRRLRLPRLARELGLELLPLETIPREEWRTEPLEGGHWARGVEVPKFLHREACVVQISNLKTHRFGGDFSASLKNTLGLVAKFSLLAPPYNYMAELHASPHQRLMIAEVNSVYQPALVILDASRVFTEAGPEQGEVAYPGVVLASRDRVAIDAAGVALLRVAGAGPPLSEGAVFDHPQIRRAVELGLGARGPQEIRFLARDEEALAVANQLTAIMTPLPSQERVQPPER